jgi:hypothetical protein
LKKKHVSRKVVLLLTILIGSFLVTSQPYLHLLPFSLIPGPEGVDMYFYGVQFGGSTKIYQASTMDPLPTDTDGIQFQWRSTQTHSASITRDKAGGEPLGGFYWSGPWWYYDHDKALLRTENKRVALLTADPTGYGSATTKIECYVQKWSSGNQVFWRKYVAYVIPADITLDLSISEGCYQWKNVKLWYALDDIVWINAFKTQPLEDPNPPQGAALNAYNFRSAFPLIAWVGGYTPWQWYDKASDTWKNNPPSTAADKHADLDPSYEGRVIDLYTQPGQRYELLLSSDMVSNPNLLQAAVESALPDPRFSRTAYLYITLNDLGAYIDPEAQFSLSYNAWSPVVHYRIRTLWVVYGEFVYAWTKEEEAKQEYQYENRSSRQETVFDVWDQLKYMTGIDVKGFMAWANSPFGMLILGIVSAIIIFVVLMVVLAVTGILGPLLMARRSRGTHALPLPPWPPSHLSYRYGVI